MPERQPEAWGISLWEAVERWTPKEVWQRYQQIAEEEVPYLIFPPGPTLCMRRPVDCARTLSMF